MVHTLPVVNEPSYTMDTSSSPGDLVYGELTSLGTSDILIDDEQEVGNALNATMPWDISKVEVQPDDTTSIISKQHEYFHQKVEQSSVEKKILPRQKNKSLRIVGLLPARRIVQSPNLSTNKKKINKKASSKKKRMKEQKIFSPRTPQPQSSPYHQQQNTSMTSPIINTLTPPKWDSSSSDLTRHRLTPAEQLRRKKNMTRPQTSAASRLRGLGADELRKRSARKRRSRKKKKVPVVETKQKKENNHNDHNDSQKNENIYNEQENVNLIRAQDEIRTWEKKKKNKFKEERNLSNTNEISISRSFKKMFHIVEQIRAI